MHPHFEFPVRQVIFTLTFAAELVLLVVLLGRDRARRFPWFTASIVLTALHLMAEILLSGRMASLPLNELLIGLADTGAIVSLLVMVEVALRSFAGLRRTLWFVNAAGLLAVAGGVLYVWGPWPAWKDMALETVPGKLHLMQLVAQKGDLLASLLAVELGLLVVLFGRYYKAGWRSHVQMIAIGLSTAAIAGLALQTTVQSIVKNAHPHSRAEYEQILGLLGKLNNANNMVFIAVLVWWIVWLWRDEPGAAAAE